MSGTTAPVTQETPNFVVRYGREFDAGMHQKFGMKTAHLVNQIALATPFFVLIMMSPVINFAATALTVAALNWAVENKKHPALAMINNIFKATAMLVLIAVALKCAFLFLGSLSLAYLALTVLFGIGSYSVFKTLKIDEKDTCCTLALVPETTTNKI